MSESTFWEPVPAGERSTALALVPATATAGALVPAEATIGLAPSAWKIAEKIAGTDFVPQAMRNKPEAVLACMLTGNELGLPLMQALAKIHVINGRPGLAAEVMRSLVLAAGHEFWIEEKSRTSVTVGGKRAGSSREQRVTWTIEDATSAKLAGKDVWKSYPRAMLTARATAELCRDLFPDIIGGLYSVEELEDGFDPALAEDEVAPAGPVERAVRKASSPAARKRLSQKAKAAAGEGPEPGPPPLPEEDDQDIVDAEVIETEEVDGDAPPPLPDDEEPPPVVQHLQDKVERGSRAQQIAIRSRELDVDRALVIGAVTAGAKTSGRELDDAEGDLVIEALRRLKVGEIRLEMVDGQPQLVDAPEAPNEEPVQPELPDEPGEDDAEVLDFPDRPADSAAWRAHIKAKGGTIAATLRQAAHVAHDLGLVAPLDIGSLAEADANLQVAILTWLEGDGS